MSVEPLKIVSAGSVSLAAYAAAYTAAFGGYYIPVSHDVSTLARRVRMEHHDLENSLLAYDARGEVAGVAGLAVRGQRGWVAGLAVVPGQRGRGRGRELMSALVGRARAAGLRRLSLEVLAANTPARLLYESEGMNVTRDLIVFERPADFAAGARRAPAPKEADAAELLAHYARLHPEPPAWQRELPSLLVADLRGLRVGGRQRPRAYALLGQGRDGNTYVSDLAAADEAGADAMCAALARVPGALKVINEPERGPFAAPLLRHGFVEVIRQHEMTTEL